MGCEPITECRLCREPFEIYRSPSERLCDCCAEVVKDETGWWSSPTLLGIAAASIVMFIFSLIGILTGAS